MDGKKLIDLANQLVDTEITIQDGGNTWWFFTGGVEVQTITSNTRCYTSFSPESHVKGMPCLTCYPQIVEKLIDASEEEKQIMLDILVSHYPHLAIQRLSGETINIPLLFMDHVNEKARRITNIARRLIGVQIQWELRGHLLRKVLVCPELSFSIVLPYLRDHSRWEEVYQKVNHLKEQCAVRAT